MSTSELFTIARTWKKPRWPLADEWIRKLWYIYTMEYSVFSSVQSFSHIRLPVTPWTAAHQAPPSRGFSRQKYWSGVPLPSPGLTIYFTYGNIHVSMLFSQITPPSFSPTEFKSLFFTSVSLLLSCIECYHYDLSKFYIYMCQYTALMFFFPACFTLYNRLQLHPHHNN